MIRIGPAGWSYADWRGRIHPAGAQGEGHPLDRLADVFPCLELNTSFYRDPEPAHQRRWTALLAGRPGFRLAIKLHRRFSHERAARTPRELVGDLAAWQTGLGALLGADCRGPLLVQFPFSFRPSPRNVRYLRALLETLAELSPVVELRRRGWFEEECLSRWRVPGVAISLIDLPSHGEHPSHERIGSILGCGPVAYLRLHGRNQDAWFDPSAHRDRKYDYHYSRSELEGLAELVRKVAKDHDDTYVITNNHFGGKAVANAVELLVLLGQAPAGIPALWAESFPALAELVPAQGQQGLFG